MSIAELAATMGEIMEKLAGTEDTYNVVRQLLVTIRIFDFITLPPWGKFCF